MPTPIYLVRKHYRAGNMQAQQREAVEKGVVWLSVISYAPGKQGHLGADEAHRLMADRSGSPSAVILEPEGGSAVSTAPERSRTCTWAASTALAPPTPETFHTPPSTCASP